MCSESDGVDQKLKAVSKVGNWLKTCFLIIILNL